MFIRSIDIHEIHARLKRDYNFLNSRDIPRLTNIYDIKRKQSDIKTKASFAMAYPVKSRAGNNWIIFMQKSCDAQNYAGKENIQVCAVTYHYCEAGIRAFYLGERNTIVGFNPHFFERYNERMSLRLEHPLDIVKTFFKKGIYCHAGMIKNGNSEQPIAFRADGLQLGEYHIKSGYMEWRTFVSKNLISKNQQVIKKKLLEQHIAASKKATPAAIFKKQKMEKKPAVYRSFNSLHASLQSKTG